MRLFKIFFNARSPVRLLVFVFIFIFISSLLPLTVVSLIKRTWSDAITWASKNISEDENDLASVLRACPNNFSCFLVSFEYFFENKLTVSATLSVSVFSNHFTMPSFFSFTDFSMSAFPVAWQAAFYFLRDLYLRLLMLVWFCL